MTVVGGGNDFCWFRSADVGWLGRTFLDTKKPGFRAGRSWRSKGGNAWYQIIPGHDDNLPEEVGQQQQMMQHVSCMVI